MKLFPVKVLPWYQKNSTIMEQDPEITLLREFMESVFSEIGVAEFENEVFHKHHPVTILAGGRRSSKQHVACRVFFSFVGGYFPSPTTTNEKSKSLRIVAQRGLSEIEKG